VIFTKRFFSTILFSIISVITLSIFFSIAYSGIPNTANPTTFLGPTLKAGYTGPLTSATAFSIAGEGGPKNFRLGGSLGWRISDNQGLKVSAEYLLQKITYAFFSGNAGRWMAQGAVGAGYQYDILNASYNPQLDLAAYYSRAPSKTLSTVMGTFIDADHVTQNFVDARRIAGSKAAGISPGITVQPWAGTVAGVDLNYDNVRYDTHYVSNENAVGLGGTVHINQALGDKVNLGLLAAVRRPFNNYQATLAWTQIPHMNNWILGLEGDYTVGKNTLPNTYNVALTANYDLDKIVVVTRDFKNESDPALLVSDNFMSWMSDPAVYMPQVLAIVDENVTLTTPLTPIIPVCVAPTLLSPIPNTSIDADTPITYPTASHFVGANLTFSAVGLPTGMNINATTGVITGTDTTTTVTTPFSVTVTATNSCGSVHSTFTITIIVD